MDFPTLLLQLKSSDVCNWKVSELETALVSWFPRWGLLLSQGSLPTFLEAVHAIISRGLGIKWVSSSPFPSMSGIKTELLRLLWYSSSLSTLSRILKVMHVDGNEAEFSNVLLNLQDSDAGKSQVVSSQVWALKCLTELYELVEMIDSDDAKLFIQLKSTLLESAKDNLSSISLLLSVSALFCISPNYDELTTASAECLNAMIRVCEVPQSFFVNHPKSKKLNDQIISAGIKAMKKERPGNTSLQSVIDLLTTLAVDMPSMLHGADGSIEKEFIGLIQARNELSGCAMKYIGEIAKVEDIVLSSDLVISGGTAASIIRSGSSSDKEQVIYSFFEKSIGNVDWIKTLLGGESESHSANSGPLILGNFNKALATNRISKDWVTRKCGSKVHEPSLSHMIYMLQVGGEVDPVVVERVNAEFRLYATKLELLDAMHLLVQFSLSNEYTKTNELIVSSILVAVGSLASEAVAVFPKLIAKLLRIAQLIAESNVQRLGILLLRSKASEPKSTRSTGELKMLIGLVSAVGGYIRSNDSSEYRDLFVSSVHLLPQYLVTLTDDTSTSDRISESLMQLAVDLVPQLDLAFVFAHHEILSAIDAVVHRAAGDHQVVAQPVVQFVIDLTHYFGNHVKQVKDSRTVVSLLSVLSVLVESKQLDEKIHVVELGQFVWNILSSHPIILASARNGAWDPKSRKYFASHLIWMHAIQLGIVLTLNNQTCDEFFKTHAQVFAERFTTAHTGDLATLEETCLLARLVELTYSTVGSQRDATMLLALPSFQFTSLLTPKSVSVYPKARVEKISGNLPDELDDDIQAPCAVPSVFAQRVVWLATDILENCVRVVSRLPVNLVAGSRSSQRTMVSPPDFHSLLDCAHFISQYLREACVHRDNCLLTVNVGDEETITYLPLSVYLNKKRWEKVAIPVSRSPLRKPLSSPHIGAQTASLMSSMRSPMIKPSKEQPKSLIDSLTPRNSPTKSATLGEGGKEAENGLICIYPPQVGDCQVRTGLSFVVPSMVTVDDYIDKLTDLMVLCLIQAMRMATTEATTRPLLDLLLSIQSHETKLPRDAVVVVKQLIGNVNSIYSTFSRRT